MTFFSHRPGFSNFPSRLPDSPDLFFSFTLLDIRYRTQSSQEKHLFPILAAEKHLFFTLFILSRTSDNITSQNNIGATNAWAVSPPQTLGDRPPSPPRFLPLLRTAVV